MFWKANVSYPLIRTRACGYQGGNVSFLKNFAYVVNKCSNTITETWLAKFPLPLIDCFREAKNNKWHSKVVNECRVVENTTMLEETRNKITIFLKIRLISVVKKLKIGLASRTCAYQGVRNGNFSEDLACCVYHSCEIFLFTLLPRRCSVGHLQAHWSTFFFFQLPFRSRLFHIVSEVCLVC